MISNFATFSLSAPQLARNFLSLRNEFMHVARECTYRQSGASLLNVMLQTCYDTNVLHTSPTAVLRSPDLRSTSVIFSTISFYLRVFRTHSIFSLLSVSPVRLFAAAAIATVCLYRYLFTGSSFFFFFSCSVLFTLLLTLAARKTLTERSKSCGRKKPEYWNHTDVRCRSLSLHNELQAKRKSLAQYTSARLFHVHTKPSSLSTTLKWAIVEVHATFFVVFSFLLFTINNLCICRYSRLVTYFVYTSTAREKCPFVSLIFFSFSFSLTRSRHGMLWCELQYMCLLGYCRWRRRRR